MALPRAQTFHDSRPMQHPEAPAAQRVFLKGRYAIRNDGVVMDNNPIINNKPNFTFVDELPQYHLDSIREAVERDRITAEAKVRYQVEEAERTRIQQERIREAIAKHTTATAALAAAPEVDTKSARHIIATAPDAKSLVAFVESAYGKKLDGRKSLNTLRHEADAYRQAAEASTAPASAVPDDSDQD